MKRIAEERAGGLPVIVRTIAHCGTAGMIAYGLLGEDASKCVCSLDAVLISHCETLVVLRLPFAECARCVLDALMHAICTQLSQAPA